MKQVLLHNGQIIVKELPLPTIKENEVLVKTAFSLISSGTELSSKQSSGGSLVKKVISHPEYIKQGLKLFKQKGLERTLQTASDITHSKTALGYSLSGTVVKTGSGVKEFRASDKVACAGAGKANHAEFVAVPKNLTVKMPQGLDFREASSVALGSIAMQGLRRADVKLGENIAVIGLGLLGQILIQLLLANGARVIGFDIQEDKVELAKTLNVSQAYNPLTCNITEKTLHFTNNKGVDAAIITASSPDNNAIIQQAMEITRKKGKVVVVGDVGLGPKRNPFYQKEIDCLISTSYGPGRYDPDYEEKGIDYPFAYVRWTEKRNMEEYLNLLAEKKVNFQALVAKIFPVEEAEAAYKFLEEAKPVKPAVLLGYHSEEKETSKEIRVEIAPFSPPSTRAISKNILNVGVIGAGGFAKAMHLPNLKKLDSYSIYGVCDLNGLLAQQTAEKFGAKYATTDSEEIINDPEIDVVMLTLPHNLHAKVAMEAARTGKAVFCEKPMALNETELQELVGVLKQTKIPYLVGFNRRFSPFAEKIKEIVKYRQTPMIIDYQMNAGFIPEDHWTQTKTGGGRNIGEACHIYDLFTFFTESKVSKVNAFSITPKTKLLKNDNFSASIKFEDGSLGNLIYTALGTKEYPKEQMRVYVDGKVIFLNDYQEMEFYGLEEKKMRQKKQDKGHLPELQEFVHSVKTGSGLPIPLWQLVQATKISFEVEEQINK